LVEGWNKLQKQFRRFYSLLAVPSGVEWEDAEDFAAVSKSMSILTDVLEKNRKYILFILRADLLDLISKANARNTAISERLGALIDAKRQKFPRLCFLSTDAILDLLSCGSNMYTIDRYLPDVYESIAHWEIVDDQITGFRSMEGEEIVLRTAVPCGINVEDCLIAFQKSVKETLAYCLKTILSTEWVGLPVKELLSRWPVQILRIAACMYLTEIGSEAEGANKDARRKLTALISHLSDFARGMATSLQRVQAENLIMWIQYLLDQSHDSTHSSSGMTQLRYYIDDQAKDNGNDMKLRVQIGNHNVNYGFEYLGASARLNLSPGTTRCMSQIMHILKQGGSPCVVGPDDSWKAETINELASITGRTCFFVELQETVDYEAMTKVFAGMLRGMWVCFKGLEGVKSEYLSVLAHELGTLQRSMVIASKTRHVHAIDGRDVVVHPTCAMFATVTSRNGAGWLQLLPNVRSLFRPVALSRMEANMPKLAQPSSRKSVASWRTPELQLIAEKLGVEVTQYHYEQVIRKIEEAPSKITLVYGETMSGKTACCDIAAELQKANVIRCYPDGGNSGALATVLQKVIEKATFATDETETWVVADYAEPLKLEIGGAGQHLLILGDLTLRLPPTVRLIIETGSLKEIRPSLLSKSTLVHVDDERVTPNMVYSTSVRKLPDSVNQTKQVLQDGYEHIVEPMLKFARSSLRETKRFVDEDRVIVKHLSVLMSAVIQDFGSDGFERLTVDEQYSWTVAALIFSSIHTIGGYPDVESRRKFDLFVREDVFKAGLMSLTNMAGHDVMGVGAMPDEGLVYDYHYDKKLLRWRLWKVIPTEKIVSQGVVIPDTIRAWYIAGLLNGIGQPVAVSGYPGIGKTNISDALLHTFCSGAAYETPVIVSHIGVRDNHLTRTRLEQTLQKKRHGTLGMRSGKSKMIFIDDMDAIVVPPAGTGELVRSWVETGRWFAGTSGTELTKVENVGMMAHFNHEKSDSNHRLLRHFVPIVVDDDMEGRARAIAGEMLPALVGQFEVSAIVSATLDIFSTTRHMFPRLPTKPFQNFSLRNVMAVIVTVKAALGEQKEHTIIQNWAHSCCRTFCDVLSSDSDRASFRDRLNEIVNKHFRIPATELWSESDPILYAPPEDMSNDTGRWLTSLYDFTNLTSRNLHEELGSNASMPQLSSDEVYAALAVYHSVRIAKGHASLIGFEREQGIWAAKLACRFANMTVVEFGGQEDWDTFLHSAAMSLVDLGRPLAILCHEHAIKAAIWRDLTAILRWGLEPTGELLARYTSRMEGLEGYTATQIHCHLRQYLSSLFHVIVLGEISPFSDIGEHYRGLCLNVPLVTSRLSVMCFTRWSLQSIQAKFERVARPSMRISQDVICKFFHRFEDYVLAIREMQYRTEGHRSYIPMSMDDAFTVLSHFYHEKYNEVDDGFMRYKTGIAKIDSLMEAVAAVEADFVRSRDEFDAAVVHTREYLMQMEDVRSGISRISNIVRSQNESLNGLRNEHTKTSNSVSAELATVTPTLHAVQKQAESLNKNDTYELKNMINPPNGVQKVLETVCILFKFDAKPNESLWETSRRMLNEFQSKITSFEFDAVTIPTILRIESYCKDPDFNPRDILKISKAGGVLASWVLALLKYHNVNLALQPKKRQVAELMAKMASVQEELDGNRTQLAELELNLSTMRGEFDQVVNRKEMLFKAFKEAEAKNRSAQELMTQLVTMRERWEIECAKLQRDRERILAKCLMAAGTVVLLGGVAPSVRRSLQAQWINELREFGLEVDPRFSLSDFISGGRMADQLVASEFRLDQVSFDAVCIARSLHSFVLIFDPYDRFIQAMKVAQRERVIYCCCSDEDIDAKLIDGMRKGSHIVLTLDREVPAIIPLILAEMEVTGESGEFEVALGEELVAVHDSFKVYFVTDKSTLAAPWVRHFVPIRMGLVQEAVKELVVTVTLPVKLREQRTSSLMDGINRRNRLEQLEKRALEFVNAVQPFDLTPTSIVDNEHELKVTKGQAEAARQLEADLSAHVKWYERIAEQLSCYWEALNALRNISCKYAAGVAMFVETCRKHFEPVQENDRQMMGQVREAFVKWMLAFFMPMLPQSQRVWFGFNLALQYHRHVRSDPMLEVPPSLLYFLVNGKADPALLTLKKKQHVDEFPPNSPAPYLTRKRWDRILELSKIPQFSHFAMEFVRFANRSTTPVTEASWEDVYRATQPWNHKFPSRWDDLTKFEKMLVSVCLRPDSLQGCLKEYAEAVFAGSLLDMPDFIEQRYQNAGPTTPILIESMDDCLPLIRRLAVKRNFINAFTVLPIGRRPLTNAAAVDQALDDCLSKGRWLVLVNCEVDPATVSSLNRRLTSLASPSAFANPKDLPYHTNFRLWLVNSFASPACLPNRLYQRAIRATLDDLPTVTTALTAIFPIIEENLIPHDVRNPTNYRNFLMNLGIFHTYLSARKAYGPAAFSTPFRITYQDINAAIRLLRDICAAAGANNDTKALVKKINSVICDLSYGCQIPFDAWSDKRLLGSHFADAMAVTWVGGDDQNVKLPALRPLHDAMQRNDMDVAYKRLQELGAVDLQEFDILGLPENVVFYRNHAESLRVAEAMKKSEIAILAEPPRGVYEVYEEMLEVCDGILARIEKAIGGSVLFEVADGSLRKVKLEAPSALQAHTMYRSHGKHMDDLVAENVMLYGRLAGVVRESLFRAIEGLQGKVLLDQATYETLEHLHADMVPRLWTRDGLCYFTCLPLSRWLDNFIERLMYVREWFSIRTEDRGTSLRTPIIFDIAKTFHPSALLRAVLLDHAITSKEPLDQLELETMVVSAKQTVPPERGCYISGMSLLGAAWDNNHNRLKESKPYELHTSITCIWLQPVVRYKHITSNACSSETQAPKRTSPKFKCPFYIYKPNASVEGVTDVSDPDGTMVGAEDLYLTNVDFPTDVPSKFWAKRNVTLVCELPHVLYM
ncbi:Dynein heavy chain 1, axonemal, partial [Rhizophlyctis rosea]